MPAAARVSAASFDVRVDAYIAKAAPFAQPILEHIRQLVHDALPDVVEDIKWGMPFFLYKDVILGNMSAFKAHCSFGLWGENVHEAMAGQAERTPDGMGSFGKLTTLEELPTKPVLRKLILSAAKKIDTGERTKAWTRKPKAPKPEAEVPPALVDGLAANKDAQDQFATMSPSCRREYCEWIAEAKKDDTRAKRVAQAVAWIAEGKNRHWRYQTS